MNVARSHLVLGLGAVALFAMARSSAGAGAAQLPSADPGDDFAPLPDDMVDVAFTSDGGGDFTTDPGPAPEPVELQPVAELQPVSIDTPAASAFTVEPVAYDPAAALADGAAVNSATYPFADLIAAAAAQYGVRPELIAAVIQTESSFNPNARAHGTTAYGLMQMTKAAAQDAGADWNALGDPATAIDAGTRYLAGLISRFGEADGVRAYYAGAGNVNAQRTHGGGNQALLAQADTYLAKVQSNVA